MNPSFTKYLSILFILIGFSSCIDNDPNKNAEGKNILDVLEVTDAEIAKHSNFKDTVYVPVYSDIYTKTKNERILLTSTLSIRNTSMTKEMYISAIDYYDTKGDLVNSYLEKPIKLTPIQSIDYVVEREDSRGGSGANFIVIWSSDDNTIKPIIETVMISTFGNHGLSFVSEGVSIKNVQAQVAEAQKVEQENEEEETPSN